MSCVRNPLNKIDITEIHSNWQKYNRHDKIATIKICISCDSSKNKLVVLLCTIKIPFLSVIYSYFLKQNVEKCNN